jgi:hypothetical protein
MVCNLPFYSWNECLKPMKISMQSFVCISHDKRCEFEYLGNQSMNFGIISYESNRLFPLSSLQEISNMGRWWEGFNRISKSMTYAIIHNPNLEIVLNSRWNFHRWPRIIGAILREQRTNRFQSHGKPKHGNWIAGSIVIFTALFGVKINALYPFFVDKSELYFDGESYRKFLQHFPSETSAWKLKKPKFPFILGNNFNVN